jgi:hypothetical protein
MTMAWFWPHPVVTRDGVYQPPAWGLELLAALTAAVFIAAAWAAGRVSAMVALGQWGMLLIVVAARAYQFFRHGWFGKPLVALCEGQLRMARLRIARETSSSRSRQSGALSSMA